MMSSIGTPSSSFERGWRATLMDLLLSVGGLRLTLFLDRNASQRSGPDAAVRQATRTCAHEPCRPGATTAPSNVQERRFDELNAQIQEPHHAESARKPRKHRAGFRSPRQRGSPPCPARVVRRAAPRADGDERHSDARKRKQGYDRSGGKCLLDADTHDHAKAAEIPKDGERQPDQPECAPKSDIAPDQSRQESHKPRLAAPAAGVTLARLFHNFAHC